ncbi:MAG TPA: AmmeMemoRadiSam system protein A [Myxococcota bacterium]|jgi:AmmeMemoRadiSam system protein A|nr:AmmeMemoRadiSam system protein A [Myxococcota bacterium]
MRSPEVSAEGKAALEPLLAVARASIAWGLQSGAPLEVEASRFDPVLQQARASFVTLHADDELRGCTGSLVAHRPLVVDVTRNAFAAAFLDPRFPPLRSHELASLHLHVSVLGPQEPVEVETESELLARLRPGVDGLVLEEGACRATFLPAVWAQLPTPEAFLQHLKRKAGLPPGHWSQTIRFWRYAVEAVEE